MEIIQVVGIIVALAFFIILSMRGHSVVITAPITAIIIIVTNGMDFWTYLVDDPDNSFAAGMGAFVYSSALLFVLSSIVGKYIDKSGAAVSIANKILKITGKDNPFLILVGVTVIGLVLTYGGVSLFVVMFAMIPLARPLFKAVDMPWHLFVAAFGTGATGCTMAMMPFSPSIMLVNMCDYCGVSLSACAGLGIICSIIMIALSFVYFKIAIKRSRAKNEKYDCILPEENVDFENLPSFGISLTPLLAMIVIIVAGSLLNINNIVYIGMTVTIILCALLFNKQIDSQKQTLADGAFDAFGPILFTATGCGVGAVAAGSPGFMVIADAIFNMPGGTLISAWTLSFILGGVAGGGLSAVNIVGQYFLTPYLATGVSPALLAKVITVAASTGGALPNAGGMFGMFKAMGLNHGNAYKHFFWVDIVITMIATVVLIVVGSFVVF